MLPLRRIYPRLVFLLALLAFLSLAAGQAGAANWRAAVDPALVSALENPGQLEFIVRLNEQADLSPADEIWPKAAKGTFVTDSLRETAARTQKDLLSELDILGVEYQAFWIVNAVFVRADADTLRQLAGRTDVSYIFANSPVDFSPSLPNQAVADLYFTEGVEWNIQLIGAPELWAMSIDGRNVVVGGQDTGYDWDHPAIKNQYRGWDGQVADHNYNWHDAIHTSTGPCGADSPWPCDDHGHGTHTMGTIVGDDGDLNKIGVAPGARWIGCRNMDGGVGTPATYIECFQWFIAPTEIGGGNPDPSRAPDVVNNSWSCPTFEGCLEPDILRQAVEAVRAAGILTVQAAGNSGPSCATIDTPAAIYDATLTVGATSSADQIASFSSRGPVLVDQSGRPKPDVVAPGVAVRSSSAGGGYKSLSGTSMAAPHVAGLAALLISATPELAGDVDQLERFITLSANRKLTSQGCPGLAGDQVPNAVYGYGRIDAVAAVRFANGPRYWFPHVFNDGTYDSAEGMVLEH